METTIVLKKEELNIDFINQIKSMFKNSNNLQITISDKEYFGLDKKETKDEYFKRIDNAIKEVEKHKIIFSINEFDNLTQDNL